MSVPQSLPLTTCAAKYAIAIADPWHPDAAGACVPTYPSRPSQKITCYTRGTCYVGQNGKGYVCVTPCLANNLSSIWYTGTTFNSDTIFPSITAPQAGTFGPTINTPYTIAQLSAGTATGGKPEVAGRIVSCALSMMYTGTELNRSGQLVCYTDPEHRSVSGLTFDQIYSRRESDISAVDRNKCWVVSYGLNAEETSFPDFAFDESTPDLYLQSASPFSDNQPINSLGTADQQTGAPIMCAWFTGVAGQSFAFEVVQHCEFIGRLADPMITPNEDDPRGFALVQSAASQLNVLKTSNPKVPLKRLMLKGLREAAKRVGPEAMALGTKMAVAALI